MNTTKSDGGSRCALRVAADNLKRKLTKTAAGEQARDSQKEPEHLNEEQSAELFARGSDERADIARNPSTSAAVLSALARDSRRKNRRYVAFNPSTLTDVLAVLAEDDDDFVRRYVAFNPSTPAAVLTTLAGDDDEEVRRAVAENPYTPDDVLVKLSSDPVRVVSNEARQAPGYIAVRDRIAKEHPFAGVPDLYIDGLIELVLAERYPVG